MTVREVMARIIADDNGDADAKARLILGYLHAIDFFSPGNGMLDDDPEMVRTPDDDGDDDEETGLDQAYEASRPYHDL